MTKTKKHFAIISLLVCLFASFALALGFGNTKKASAEGDTSYTLSFLGESTNMIKDGWADGYATITDDVLTLSFTSGTDGYSPAISLKNGKTYVIKMDIRTDDESGTGCWVYADSDKVQQTWDCIFKGGVVAGNATINSEGVITGIKADWSTVSIKYTPTKNISYLRFTDWGKKGFQLKNFTITEKLADDITVTADAAIGNLPAVPEEKGYIGHWEIDGVAINAETIYNYAADKNAVPVYEKAYTLSFQKETNLMTTEGWSGIVSPTLSDGVLDFTFPEAGKSVFYSYNTVQGRTYSIKFEAQAVGETGGIGVHLFTSDWNVIKEGEWIVESWNTYSYEWKATADSTLFGVQCAWNDLEIQFRNFTITEIFCTKTLKAGEKVGTLPEVACGTNYSGYWKIGETKVTESMTITKDEIACPVVEYSGHIFKSSEFVLEEAKNGSSSDSIFAIKYIGEAEVRSWSDKEWGQFADQKIALKVKKADGTEATVTSSQMQLDKSILWLNFATNIYDDIVEITIPAGEYKLSDGTGFKFEEITFYMVHYNCWLNEKTDYKAEHIAEVKETCTTDGCLDYYHCEKCGKYFEDAACTAEIENLDEWKNDADGGLLEKLGHEAASKWKSDETNHWHECKICGEKVDEAAHTDGDNDKKCDVCGVKLGGDENLDSEEKKSGCGSSISLAPLTAVMLCALGVIFFRRRKNHQ